MRIYENIEKVWINVYDGDGDGVDDGAGGNAGDGTPPPKTFTQEEVNAMLKKDKQKHQAQTQTAIDELEALRTKVQMTTKERDEFDSKIEELQSKLMTKEEVAKRDAEKARKKHEKELDDAVKERDTWKNNYTDLRIGNAIMKAAVDNKAINPELLVSIIRPTTNLTEELDEGGEPAGKLVPMVKFTDSDKEGKEVTLDLSPSEAIKRMTEMEKYQHLFEGEGTGGLGRSNRPTSGSRSSKEEQRVEAAKRGDYAAYERLTKELEKK